MSVTTETIINVSYPQDSQGFQGNEMGMREMQARAFAKRNARFLLIKAPPACGKSRALMYLALDKVLHQGLKKVIVAVPQTAIGSSFKSTDLKSSGFFANWAVEDKYNLCYPGADSRKAQAVLDFIDDPYAHYLICAHPTLINFFDKLEDKHKLDQALIAVDEFHHVSAEEGNRLGAVIHYLMSHTKAHIVAMTGSYFRGDQVPVLDAQDEAQFEQVTYTYYEQLRSYKYLKSLSIDYAFYDGRWIDAITEILDPNKKTIIHIPSVNSRESTHDKVNEVGIILDALGEHQGVDSDTGIYKIKRSDGSILKVADLVTDTDLPLRTSTLNYLRTHQDKDAVDIIIALGMAKEGFDWPWCEHALTVGYRNSLTEIVQIIGRATRDAPGKTSAKFTNLIAKPDALQEDVGDAVNTLLKAISLSLLMEQVLAPNVRFKVRSPDHDEEDDNNDDPGSNPGTGVVITIPPVPGANKPSKIARKILEKGIDSIIERVLNNPGEIKPMMLKNQNNAGQILRDIELPLLIDEMYPQANLTPAELELIANAVLVQLNRTNPIPGGQKPQQPVEEGSDTNSEDHQPGENQPGNDNGEGGETNEDEPQQPGHHKPVNKPHIEPVPSDNPALLNVGRRFINLDELDINLILKTNPFQRAYDFVSRNLDPDTLRAIQDRVVAQRAQVTEKDATLLWPYMREFKLKTHRDPSPTAADDYERRLGEVLAYIRAQKQKAKAAEAAARAQKE